MDRSRLRLIAITERQTTPGDWFEAAAQALRGGVTAIWLREKDLSALALYEAARRLRDLTRQADAALLVSDRIDVALAAEADAVHLGWTSLPVEAARRVVGTQCRIGVSTHTLQEARDAAHSGADYITFSPVFPTPSKEGLVAVTGLKGLREAVAEVPIPVVALGGIQAENAPDCLDMGAAGVACIRAVFGSGRPGEAARKLAAVLARSGLE